MSVDVSKNVGDKMNDIMVMLRPWYRQSLYNNTLLYSLSFLVELDCVFQIQFARFLKISIKHTLNEKVTCEVLEYLLLSLNLENQIHRKPW